MTQIGQAREVCGINYSVCTVEGGGGGDRRPKDSVSWCLGVGRGGKSLEMDGWFKSFSLLAYLLRWARNLLPNQHLLIYSFAPLSMLSQECRERGACTLGELKNRARHNITFIVPPKGLRSARGRLVFQTASASSLLGAHSFFVPSTEKSATQAGMDGEQTVGSSPLLRVATCGLREHTAVAMTTNKAVFV